jgi:hypothetical protein
MSTVRNSSIRGDIRNSLLRREGPAAVFCRIRHGRAGMRHAGRDSGGDGKDVFIKQGRERPDGLHQKKELPQISAAA